jgi:hypothetical protein
MRRIFISYRRDDSGGQTGHLFDDLKERFGENEIFRDLEDLDPGVEYPEALNKALTDCEVMLAMIGARWSTIAEPRGRRIDQPDDVVRMEVAKALGRKGVCVIPVLVGGAKLPLEQELPKDLRPLLRRTAFDLSDNRWDYDVNRLGDAIAKLLGGYPRRRSVRIWATAAALAIVVLAISGFYIRRRFGNRPAAEQRIGLPHDLAMLNFSIGWNDQKPPGLSFREWLPNFRDEIPLAAASDGTYKQYIEWPDGDKHFEASVLPIVTESTNQPNPFKKTSICFTTNTKLPTNSPPFKVLMRCAEGGKCSLDSNDGGWAAETECSDKHTQISRSFSLVPALLAESLDRRATQGWTVPSLATLKQMTDSRRAGYTEFSIKANPVPGLEAADRFRYEIIANGTSLSVDGWPPEDMLKEFNASKGLDFSFGMENLSFSGADRGCESIGVVLEFRKGSQLVKKVHLQRQYAALRDAVPEVQSLGGVTFTWTGTYVKPKNEDRAEVFVITTSDANKALQVKSRIDGAKLSYQGMSVVGVIRPPLNQKNLGIVVGIVQPSGQVKFTFDTTYVQQLRNWVLQQDRRIFQYPAQQPPFIYQSKPGPAGTGALKWCSTAAG